MAPDTLLANTVKAPISDRESAHNGLYDFVGGSNKNDNNMPSRIAWELEDKAMKLGWPSNHLMGSEKQLTRVFGVSRETMREAIRILERRGAMRMFRGRYGGLRLIQPDINKTAEYLVSYLKIIGYCKQNIAEAAHIFDRMLIAWVIDNGAPFHKLSSQSSFRSQLSAITGEALFILYARALDAIEHPLKPEASDFRLLRHIYDELEGALNAKDKTLAMDLSRHLPTNILDSDSLEAGSHAQYVSSPTRLAMRIIKYSNNLQDSDQDAYFSESDLYEIIDENRSLIRQALRILQDADMLVSKCGRTGGFALKQPSPAGIIRQVFPLMVLEKRNIKSLSRLIWQFNLAQLELANQAMSQHYEKGRKTLCSSISRHLSSLDEPKRWIFLQQQIGLMAKNPLLDTLIRCAVTYLTRRGQIMTHYPDDATGILRIYEENILDALAKGDSIAALTNQQAAQALLMKL